MPEYDAFGREIGENTLSGLGGDPAPAESTRQAEPVPAGADGWSETTVPRPEPRAPERPQVTFSVPEGAPVTVVPGVRRRRTGGVGCLVALLIAGAVVAGPVIAIVAIVGSASDVIDDVTDAIDEETLDLPEVTPPDEAAPTGITGRSLIAKGNLSDALRRLERDGFAKVVMVVVRPDRLNAETVKGGRQRNVMIGSDGAVTRGDASRANKASGSVPIAAIDPAAPTRLVRGAAKRFRVREQRIDYVIASPSFEGGHRWIAYFKNDVYVEGDERGRVLRRIN